MPISTTIQPGLYKDSVALMRAGQLVLAQPGVQRATLLMGTPANKELLADAGLWRPELEAARPNDLMIVVDAQSDEAVAGAHAAIAKLLRGEPARSDSAVEVAPPRSIAMAVAAAADVALAQISVPGPYAGAEALKALRRGLHVFLFSDNVPLEQERALKELARRKDLLVMGPDCGTAIIRGVPLGFANVVRRGAIGWVGASGTGLQEVTCRVHALGEGVSQVIGTGGRDVYREIGGITMRQGIELLAADPETRVIGIVAKPPAPEVAKVVVECAAQAGKPCVLLFLGADLARAELPAQVVPVTTLQDAARAAVALLGQGRLDARHAEDDAWHAEDDARAGAEASRLAPGQRFLYGLYSGGTFCTEAQLVWRALGLRTRSNVPLDAADRLGDEPAVAAHRAIDFGADEFTLGRPHPMIDVTTRRDQIVDAARDPAVAALVVDVVIGYGAHADPAGTLATAIAEARGIAQKAGRHLPVVTFVCGTEEDPQRLSVQ
ncbi:MAG TPA: acyl-CoA synthetase FdrA, partial [Casimicrobiaceae bacterium]